MSSISTSSEIAALVAAAARHDDCACVDLPLGPCKTRLCFPVTVWCAPCLARKLAALLEQGGAPPALRVVVTNAEDENRSKQVVCASLQIRGGRLWAVSEGGEVVVAEVWRDGPVIDVSPVATVPRAP